MKAMVLKAPGDLALGEIERPRPEPDEVLVRVTHTGICGTDLKIYSGVIPVRCPLVMGHEMIGEVVDGDGKVCAGQRVIVDPVLYCGACFHCRAGESHLCPNGTLLGRDADGGFAEYAVAPRSHVYPLPQQLDERAAPLVQVLTTCVHAQRLVGSMRGDSVLVMGLGVTGQLHVQLAKAQGARLVMGVTRSAWKRDLAESLGADMTLPPGEAGIRRVLDATDGRGADLVIECTGVPSALAEAICTARFGSRLLLFGITTVTEAALPFYQFYLKELTIFNARAAKSEDYPEAIELVRRRLVQLGPLITHVMPLAELGTALGLLQADADRRMKIVLENQ